MVKLATAIFFCPVGDWELGIPSEGVSLNCVTEINLKIFLFPEEGKLPLFTVMDYAIGTLAATSNMF